MTKLKNGTKVIVHSFGDGRYSLGTIKGIISEHITIFYIVELPKDNPWSQDYDCISVPQGCLAKFDESKDLFDQVMQIPAIDIAQDDGFMQQIIKKI